MHNRLLQHTVSKHGGKGHDHPLRTQSHSTFACAKLRDTWLSFACFGSIDLLLIYVSGHYGYNRTGFFIVCYLVERLGYKLEDAIREFAEKRLPRGIKHEYFIDELYVRYAVKGLARRGTVVRLDD